MGVENLLRDPEYGRVWERMRRGEWRGQGPNVAEVDFSPDGSSEVSLRLNA